MIRQCRVLFVLAAFAMSALLPVEVVAQTKPLCIGDSVVWENSRSKIYHAEGDPYFGKTAHGQYACKAAAEKDGYRLSKSTGGASGGSKTPSATAKPAFSLFGPRATATPAPDASPASKRRRKKSTAASGPATSSTAASATPAPAATKKPRRSRKKKASPSPSAT